MKMEILKGTGETNSKRLGDILLGWQFTAEIKSRFQMPQAEKADGILLC